LRGKVVRSISGFYDIKSKDKIFRVRGSGNLRENDTSLVVGDEVEFDIDGFLTKVYPRKNFLVRPKVANIDQAVIVISVKEPRLSKLLLNKFLANIEFANIHPVILFTKIDKGIAPIEEYRLMGYRVFEIDNNKALPKELKKIFKDKLTVFTGQTGVGKSTTINNIAKLNREVQEISKALGRGKHTTRVVEVVDWAYGELIDTPGFSKLKLQLNQKELSKSWHIFKNLSRNCEFNDCLHINEKHCAIKNKIGKLISNDFYEIYLRLNKEIKNKN